MKRSAFYLAVRSALVASVIGAGLVGCAVGPDYPTPATHTPEQFKATEDIAESDRAALGWQPVEPVDFSRMSAWWTLFDDPLLDQLQQQVNVSNQNLAQAEARYRQALASLRGARAGFYPTLGADAAYVRQGGGVRTNDQGFSTSSSAKRYDFDLSLSWELDLWGRLRRQLEADRAAVHASEAELAGARLSAQSTLAQSYFQLRVLDAQTRLYEQTLAAYTRSLQLTQNQYRAGFVAKADMVQAQTQLERTRAQAIDLEWQRTQLENAIAVLTGKTPSQVRIARSDSALPDPVIPAMVPATLLQRRPDIAAAERGVAAANARIGVAQAAWFPTLSLSASDRKSTRLNSSHVKISYAVFCLKKEK